MWFRTGAPACITPPQAGAQSKPAGFRKLIYVLISQNENVPEHIEHADKRMSCGWGWPCVLLYLKQRDRLDIID